MYEDYEDAESVKLEHLGSPKFQRLKEILLFRQVWSKTWLGM